MNKIVEIAQSYIGQREITGNKGFLDKSFESDMKAQDWYVGAPWCMFFAKLVWYKTFLRHKEHFNLGEAIKLMNGSAVRSYTNLSAKEFRPQLKPVEGSLVIWRSYKNGQKLSTGHAGIVTKVNSDDTFETVEGNTTDKGGREGVMVATRIRHYEWNRDNGLRLLGFINP